MRPTLKRWVFVGLLALCLGWIWWSSILQMSPPDTVLPGANPPLETPEVVVQPNPHSSEKSALVQPREEPDEHHEEEERITAHEEWLVALTDRAGLGLVVCVLPDGTPPVRTLTLPFARQVGRTLSFAVDKPDGRHALGPIEWLPSPRLPRIGDPEDMQRFLDEHAEWEEHTRPIGVVHWSGAESGARGDCTFETWARAEDAEGPDQASDTPLAGARANGTEEVLDELEADPTLSDAAREDLVSWRAEGERALMKFKRTVEGDLAQIEQDRQENQSLFEEQWEAWGLSRIWPSQDLDALEEEDLEWVIEEVEDLETMSAD